MSECYRIQCCICPATTDRNKMTGGRKKPHGWTVFWRIRSVTESYRMKPKPGETDFDVKTHWQTHYGICDRCTTRMNKECRSDEEKAAWVNEHKKF